MESTEWNSRTEVRYRSLLSISVAVYIHQYYVIFIMNVKLQLLYRFEISKTKVFSRNLFLHTSINFRIALQVPSTDWVVKSIGTADRFCDQYIVVWTQFDLHINTYYVLFFLRSMLRRKSEIYLLYRTLIPNTIPCKYTIFIPLV